MYGEYAGCKKVLEAALFMAPGFGFNYFKKLLNFETKEQVIQTLRDLKADYDAKILHWKFSSI